VRSIDGLLLSRRIPCVVFMCVSCWARERRETPV
jgi:hypothetical protein